MDYQAFVNMSDEQIKKMDDTALAESFTRALLLHQKANVSREFSVFRYREQAAALYNKLDAEIKQRGKVWQVPFYGRPYLEPAPK